MGNKINLNNDLVGSVVNNIEIIDFFTKNKRSFFKCKCFCGKEFINRCEVIKTFKSPNCGCKTSDLLSAARRLPNSQATINVIYRWYKRNANTRNISFNLSIEEFKNLIILKCKYCGAKPKTAHIIKKYKNRRERFFAYNGVDRVDNTKDYNLENCVPCCQICNRAKKDLSLEIFNSWIARIAGNYLKENNNVIFSEEEYEQEYFL